MVSEAELQEEIAGSVKDIQQACESVKVTRYNATNNQLPQLDRIEAQSIFDILVRRQDEDDPDAPLRFVIAQCLPKGYVRLVLPCPRIDLNAAPLVDFVVPPHCDYSDCLDNCLKKHSPAYKRNKQQELMTKLFALQQTQQDHSEDEAQSDTETT